ncbi:MAG: hypothetical protein EAY81_00215 [Bacteroidetes bacterium]|nr:MAG: hypothetical protein EAY81_00215 [Bacteroidota bacterium]
MSKLNTWRLVIPLLIGLTNVAIAQQKGIYLSAADFNKGIVSFTQAQHHPYQLKFNGLFNRGILTIHMGDSTFRIHQDSVFGYQDDEGISYRFYHNNIYQVLNPRETLLLYSITTIRNAKENLVTSQYFFSNSADSAIYPLTKFNLKKAFPLDAHLHEQIDLYFKTDADLIAFDNYYHLYKINRILQLKQP